MASNRTKLLLAWLAATIFLAIWYPLFSTMLRPQNDSWSDSLVTNALIHASGKGTLGDTHMGVSLPFKTGETSDLLVNSPNESYKSAFGLQGYLAVWTWKLMGSGDPLRTTHVLRFLYSGLLGGLLVAFAWDVRKRFGLLAGMMVGIAIVSSPFIAFFGRSLHWQGWLIFLPFVFSWIYYPKFAAEGRYRQFWAIVAVMVMARSLVGYEFLSNIAIACCIRPFLYHIEESRLKETWRAVALSSLLATLIGFSGAFAVHVAALSPEVGGPIEAVKHIKSRAEDRMSSRLSIEDAALMKNKPRPVSDVVRNYAIDFGVFMIPGGVCIAGSLLLLISALRDRKRYVGEAVMMGLGTLASFSWALLMPNHMYIGPVHNKIIFFLPMYFMSLIVLARVLERGEKITYAVVEERETVVVSHQVL